MAAGLAVAGWLPGGGTRSRASARAGAAEAGSASAGSAPADAFLAAWRAHLSSTWSVDQVGDRTTDAGAHLRLAVHEAQRPPDRVRTGLGSVDARRGSTLIACASASSVPLCRTERASGSWQEAADAEISGLRGALTGNTAVYSVAASGPGCFQFTLRRPAAVVPVTFGRGARYCLDPSSGAVLSSTVERVGAVDTLTTVEHHSPATDADLALPTDARYG